MTLSGWRKLGVGIVVAYFCFVVWANRHATRFNWTPDSSGAISGDGGSSSSSFWGSSSDDDDSSGSADAGDDGDAGGGGGGDD